MGEGGGQKIQTSGCQRCKTGDTRHSLAAETVLCTSKSLNLKVLITRNKICNRVVPDANRTHRGDGSQYSWIPSRYVQP